MTVKNEDYPQEYDNRETEVVLSVVPTHLYKPEISGAYQESKDVLIMTFNGICHVARYRKNFLGFGFFWTNCGGEVQEKHVKRWAYLDKFEEVV